ncbi:pteridine reductase [Moraxella canis]|uniref:pteridine reductase n=1 Tax=Moraxella canis TaxID=90239 RepID=UPI0006657A1A|nr:pteridine reductase [Moraxella canis]
MTKTALITGGAKRIGAAITRLLHQEGFNVIIHYHQSQAQAAALNDELNRLRPNSAAIICADLNIVNHSKDLSHFAEQCARQFGRIDALIHNASSFYPSDLSDTHDALLTAREDLLLTNAKAPLFLTHALLPKLKATQGCIISLLDIHADAKPFIGYPIYNMAKSAHQMMVQSLALELAPGIRINGVAPGANIFPDSHNPQLNHQTKAAISASIPLERIGTPDDIAQAVLFLIRSSYITGQILAVDGGRSLTLKGG